MADEAQTIQAWKGFDSQMRCRDFQFEVGKTYTHEGKVEACASGFHACENPLDVFAYYAPGESRYAKVTMSGALARHADDSKIAGARITIDAELTLPQFIPQLVGAAIEWVKSRCKPAEEQHATGYSSASSATGYSSASSATGDSSASSATGDSSASSATGYRSASSATGYSSASSATGDRSASSATGNSSASSATGNSSASSATGYRSASSASGIAAVAMNIGRFGRASASDGAAIVLVYHNDDGTLRHIFASKVGENGIKPDTFYTLNEDGTPVEWSIE